jgi:hypothetical protein
MGPRYRIVALAIFAVAATACSSGRRSSAAFHLPPDGDVDRGKVAFVALECNSCHEVPDVDVPRPTVRPPVPVVLGGTVDFRLSDAYLVTSIIYPSYELAPYPKDQIISGGQSRMPQYANRMTVRQLADTVAFLQSRYSVVQVPADYR